MQTLVLNLKLSYINWEWFCSSYHPGCVDSLRNLCGLIHLAEFSIHQLMQEHIAHIWGSSLRQVSTCPRGDGHSLCSSWFLWTLRLWISCSPSQWAPWWTRFLFHCFPSVSLRRTIIQGLRAQISDSSWGKQEGKPREGAPCPSSPVHWHDGSLRITLENEKWDSFPSFLWGFPVDSLLSLSSSRTKSWRTSPHHHLLLLPSGICLGLPWAPWTTTAPFLSLFPLLQTQRDGQWNFAIDEPHWLPSQGFISYGHLY